MTPFPFEAYELGFLQPLGEMASCGVSAVIAGGWARIGKGGALYPRALSRAAYARAP
jgi:hypothetical protein